MPTSKNPYPFPLPTLFTTYYRVLYTTVAIRLLDTMGLIKNLPRSTVYTNRPSQGFTKKNKKTRRQVRTSPLVPHKANSTGSLLIANNTTLQPRMDQNRWGPCPPATAPYLWDKKKTAGLPSTFFNLPVHDVPPAHPDIKVFSRNTEQKTLSDGTYIHFSRMYMYSGVCSIYIYLCTHTRKSSPLAISALGVGFFHRRVVRPLSCLNRVGSS